LTTPSILVLNVVIYKYISVYERERRGEIERGRKR
jgi:hypothetical protein